MPGGNTNPKPTKRKNAPIRVVVRCAWSGARLPVPTTANNNDPLPPLRGASTLLDVVLRLESALPPALLQRDSAAALVCLRKTVPQSAWESTTLKQMLDGDDGSAGVILTLELATAVARGARQESDPVEKSITSAASSLNIKPVVASTAASAAAPPARAVIASLPAPDTSKNDTRPGAALMNTLPPPGVPAAQQIMSPEQAWAHVLQSNFDATTKDCLTTLLKMIDNLLSRPNEPKVRSIRCANAAFERKVGRCVGGYEFLFSIGFVPQYPVMARGGAPVTLELPPQHESRETLLRGRRALALSAVGNLGMAESDVPPVPAVLAAPPPTGLAAPPPSAAAGSGTRGAAAASFDIYKARSNNMQSAAAGAPDPYGEAAATLSTTERQLQRLAAKKDKLEQEMQSIQVDRGLVAYHAGGGPAATEAATGAGSGGGTDSSLVAARMRRMEEERKKREEGGFTTKAMRDLERMKKAKVYSHAQIRVNFSDGTHLHAKFLPRERVAAVRAVVASALQPSLAHSLEFDLYVAPPRRVLDDARTLEQEDLVPAARIHVSWRAGAAPVGDAPGGYLRPELFADGGNAAASAFPAAKPVVRAPTARRKAAGDKSDGRGDPPSKEELLMQRMLGKKGGMFGKKGGMFGGKKKS